MKILAQAGYYQCGECGEMLRFDPCKVSEHQAFGIGYCVNEDSFSNITGELLRKGCSRVNVRVKVMIQLLECEVVPADEHSS